MNHTLKPQKCFRLSKQLLWCFQSSVAVPFLGILKFTIQSMPKDKKKKYSKPSFLNELEIQKGLVHHSEQPYRDDITKTDFYIVFGDELVFKGCNLFLGFISTTDFKCIGFVNLKIGSCC